jgi:hypothetical protein
MVFAYSIGKDPRKDTSINRTAQIVPGAGTYQVATGETAQAAPKWKFGTGKRPEMKLRQASNVGPGDYPIP